MNIKKSTPLSPLWIIEYSARLSSSKDCVLSLITKYFFLTVNSKLMIKPNVNQITQSFQ